MTLEEPAINLDPSGLVDRFCAVGLTPDGKSKDAGKPLLLLAALSRRIAGKPSRTSAAELAALLEPWLREFGRRTHLFAASFWNLQDDGIWEVSASAEKMAGWQRRQPTERSLIAANASGGFPESIDMVLRNDTRLAGRISSELLARFFPTQADRLAAALGFRRAAVRHAELDPNIVTKFALRALNDVFRVLRDDEREIGADVAVHRLKAIESSPWASFPGTGLTQEMLWSLLKPFGVEPEPIGTADDSRNCQVGYSRAALEQAAHVPVATWVARVGNRPTVPPEARRIRDMRLRKSNERVRKAVISKRWTPFVLCDDSGCYWDGHNVSPKNSNESRTISKETSHELLNMCASGEFGDSMKDVFIHESRWHHILWNLVDHPSATMILRDSLHYPGQEVQAPRDESASQQPTEVVGIAAGSQTRMRLMPRRFDPDWTQDPFVGSDQRCSPAEILQLQEQAVLRHRQVLVALHGHLVRLGWRAIEEIPGAIDLWAISPSKVRVIFEAKTVNKSNEVEQCRAALAQLLEYRFFFGDPRDELCLVVDGTVCDERRELLEAVGVAVMSARDGRLCGVGARGNRLVVLGLHQ